jgi:hypothetical protein
MLGTRSLLKKNKNMIVNVKYKVHNTPNNDEKRKALIFLGIDIGNMTPNAYMTLQIRSPLSFYPKYFKKS